MRFGRTIVVTGLALVAGAALGSSSSNRPSGATAVRPASILAIGRDAIVGALDDGVLSVAAAMAFYALLSLVPALSVLISVYGLVTTPSQIPAQLAALDLPIPADLSKLIAEQAERLAATSAGTLSGALVASVAVAVWSANAAVKAAFEGLDRMWDLKETRSFLSLNAVTLGFTIIAVLAIVVMLFGFALVPVAKVVDGREAVVADLALLRWPVMLGIGFVAVAMLYRLGPDRSPPRFALQVPGAVFATLAWVGVSAGFSWYAATLGSYSATYGSLAGIVVILTWAWLSSIIVLIGGEVCAVVERQISDPR